MRTRSLSIATAGALAVGLALSGCTSPLESIQNDLEGLIEELEDIEVAEPIDEPADDSSTANDEADETDEVAMPSGFPSELPLPDGKRTLAMRNGADFVINYDDASAASMERIDRWFEQNGWELVDDFESPPTRAWSWGSPETDDYGHLRMVTLGFNSDDGFATFFLEQRED